MTKSLVSILEAIDDPNLFQPWFKGESWDCWRAFLATLFGEALEGDKLDAYRRHTGRKQPPNFQAKEGWLIVGRRGGKSLIAALVAVYIAFFRDYSKILAPGEWATVMVIAADRRQARVVMRYISGLVDNIPLFTRSVQSRTSETFSLSNRVIIEVHTASFRAVRGYSVAAAICDEIAFWRSENSANPDEEILAGLRPGMATIPGALLLCISSPYARRGALWNAFKEHYGRDRDAVLVWKAETRSMNPTLDESVVLDAYQKDPSSAEAEYGAEFRRDIESFFQREMIEDVIVPGRRELPPQGATQYVGFCDPSGGSQDSMTLAIAHHENGKAVLDSLRERRPPFSPEQVVSEFADLLKEYGISRVSGDRYGGEWPRERFLAHGVSYDHVGSTKNEIYQELLPVVNSGRVELLDDSRLMVQLLGLERKCFSGGRAAIDHSPGGKDDLANAAAGALLEAIRPLFSWDLVPAGGGRRQSYEGWLGP